MKFLSKHQRIELELDLYKRERLFEIDSDLKKRQLTQENALDKCINDIEKDLFKRKNVLFDEHDDLRSELHEKRTKLLSEITGLEAKKECFDAEIKSLNKIIVSKDLVISAKDSEIKNLNTIINLLIKDYPKLGGSETTINKVK